jgi:type I restriction enzyme M protein
MVKAKPKSQVTNRASLDRAVKSICDVLRRDKAKGARLYVPELTWMLFLCALDLQEAEEEARAAALGLEYKSAISAPYRWRDWATPPNDPAPVFIRAGFTPGAQRTALTEKVPEGTFLSFVNGTLFPYLKQLGSGSQDELPRVISMIFSNKESTMLESETNLLDAIDRVDALCRSDIDHQHMFMISQAFEGLLPWLGEKKNDGGQFFTPREVVRVVVDAVDPQLGGTVYDPCCGTGGFLIESAKHLQAQSPSPTQLRSLKTETLWGREDASEAIPLCLANMVLHGIDFPRVWHGNTLTGVGTEESLFEGAPNQFSYIFTNPPFGSKEGLDAQASFAYKTSKAQVLFLQHITESLADGGTCGMVIDEGVLFHTKTQAFVQTKRKLLNECNLWCILSLPPGVFVNAGAGVKTNLLFFTKGQPTERVWYYDLSDVKVTKRRPLLYSAFSEFFELLALDPEDERRVSERSWYQTIDEIKAKKYDLKATNLLAPDTSDQRTPEELLDLIESAQREIEKALAGLRAPIN